MTPPPSHPPIHLPSAATTSLSTFADSLVKTINTLGVDLAQAHKTIDHLQAEVKHLSDSRLSQQLQLDALVAEQHRIKERLARAPEVEAGGHGVRVERRRSEVAAPAQAVRLPEVRNGMGRPGPEGKRDLLAKASRLVIWHWLPLFWATDDSTAHCGD